MTDTQTEKTPREHVLAVLTRYPDVVAKFHEAVRRIMNEPDGYDQTTYGVVLDPTPSVTPHGEVLREAANESCSTAMCIAGHYAIVAGCRFTAQHNGTFRGPNGNIIYPPSAVYDGLTFTGKLSETCYGWTAEQTAFRAALGNLFTGQPAADWPKPFSTRWNESSSNRERAQIAADRVKHFLEVGE